MAINLLEELKKNPFVLAPMAGITDHAFRTFMKKQGAGVVVSELVSVNGIEHKSERTLKLLSFDETQRPVGLQLFGDDPEMIGRAAQLVEELGADFVDLNFGCPVPKVVKKGAGSAVLKDLPHLTRILKATKKAVRVPVTIKIRTGWDQNTRNADQVADIAYNEGITWVAIHGRTRAQAYTGLADWDYIAEVKSKAKLPILGNGDIHTPEQAVQRLMSSGCDGVLIGRGALKNPQIFAQALALYKKSEAAQTMQIDFSKIYLALYEELLAQCADPILQIQLKKFAAWFATGYPGAAHFRKSIFQVKETQSILSQSLEFFSSINSQHQQDTSSESFLMGGHG